MTQAKQLKLGAFIRGPGHHLAAWRHPDVGDVSLDFAHYLKAAQVAERGLFDTIFLANSRDGAPGAHDRAIALAELEVSQSVTPVTDLVLDATTRLFDALGGSATKREFGLDRHWRNARTIASHNPRVYHDRGVGNFAVNGTLPAGQYRVGRPA